MIASASTSPIERCSRRTSIVDSEPDGAVEAEPRGVEDLVGVDVPDAADHVLVGEQRLERRRAVAQDRGEAVPADDVLDRVDAEVGELGDLAAERDAVAADGEPRVGRHVDLDPSGGATETYSSPNIRGST